MNLSNKMHVLVVCCPSAATMWSLLIQPPVPLADGEYNGDDTFGKYKSVLPVRRLFI